MALPNKRVNLTDTVTFEKEDNLSNILLRAKWKEKSENWDIDISVICLRKDGSIEYVVYWNGQEHPSGAIVHGGDNTTGRAESGSFNSGERNPEDWDKERISIDLDKLIQRTDVYHLVLAVNVFAGRSNRQYLDQVRDCKVLVDTGNGKPLLECSFDHSKFKEKTGFYIMDIHRNESGGWSFDPIGEAVLDYRVEKDMARNASAYYQKHGTFKGIASEYDINISSFDSSYNSTPSNSGSSSSGDSRRKRGLFGRLFG